MTDRQSGTATDDRLAKETNTQVAFGGSGLWVGRHSADQDILVFDPSQADPHAPVVSLYSLTQHRMRSFPRATALARIHPLTDEVGCARAKEAYSQRATLRTSHEQGLAEAVTARKGQQRDSVLAAHRRYIERIGLPYQGVRDTAAGHRSGRRTKCHACGIALDDFAGSVCVACQAVLCSCGACACVRPAVDHG